MSNIKHLLSVSTILCSVSAVPAFAQEPVEGEAVTDAATAEIEHDDRIDTIVVTARKREESLNDIPLAVSAFTSEHIERAGIDDIEDLTTLVPAFSQVPAQDPGTNIITIRGITQVRFGEPPVALVVDGVQASSPDQGTQELVDIERIEVLKGPQGSTYGRNAIGGAINIITREPTNEFENRLSAEVGEGLYYRLFGSSSGPIVDDVLRYRLSAAYSDDEGRITNKNLGRKVDNLETLTLNGRLIWNVTDHLTADLRGRIENADGGSAYYYPLYPGQDTNDVQPVVANRDGDGIRRLRDVSLKLDYEFDSGISLTSISAFAYVKAATIGQDLDFLPYPLQPGFGGLILDQTRRTESVSEEIRLTSSSDGPFRWLVGAYYLHTDRDVDSAAYLDATGSGPYRAVQLSYLPERNDNDAYALFATLDYDISDRWALSLGLRQDWDARHQTNPANESEIDDTFKSLQPKASISYFFTSDNMVYASAARGFRSGGFNAQSNIFPRQYDAEIANTYEMGTKLSLADGRVQLNMAAFYTDQKNVQFYRWDSVSAAQGILTIDDGYHYGVEGDLTAGIGRGFRLFAGGSLIESEIQDYNGTDLYKGNDLPHINGWKYYLGGEYETALTDYIDAIVRLDYSAFGDLYWFVDNLEKQDPVHLVNARMTIEKEPWTLTVSAENLFNKRYNTDYFSSFFAGTPTDVGFPNQPRQVNVKIGVQF